jgi:hypothetical protein
VLPPDPPPDVWAEAGKASNKAAATIEARVRMMDLLVPAKSNVWTDQLFRARQAPIRSMMLRGIE